MTENTLIELLNSNLKLAINPTGGASLAYFKMMADGHEIDIMRPATEKSIADSDASRASMYPILPYVGSIHGGCFLYWGIKRKVPGNISRTKEPFDGDGWKFAWQVKEKTNDKVVLTTISNSKKAFPFSYEAKITYTLKENTFTTHMFLRNVGILPMPCAMGIHPFFIKTNDVILKFKNKNVWEHNSTPLRDKPYDAPDEWIFTDGQDITQMTMETCFGGCDGKAEITWPTRGLRVNINAFDEFNHAILCVSRGKNVFSFEPVSSTVDAFNLASRGIMGTGIKSIGPGETIEATVEITVTQI